MTLKQHLGQLPRELLIELLLEQRGKLSAEDAAALDRRVAFLIETSADRARLWREENAEALEEQSQFPANPLRNIT